MTAFQRQRAETRALSLSRPQGDLFAGYAEAEAEAEAERAQFRRTEYGTIAPFLDALPKHIHMMGGVWVEFCAGDGAIIKHVTRWRRDRGYQPLLGWCAVELREVPDLRTSRLADGPEFWRAYDGTDFTEWAPDSEVRAYVTVAITNLPWYGWEPIVEHAFRVLPGVHVAGLSCVREVLDGERPEWHREHPANMYVCNGRQTFGADAGYPHPVAWFHWPPGGHTRPAGTWRVLPRYVPHQEEPHHQRKDDR